MKPIKKPARSVLVSCSLLFFLTLVSCKPGSEEILGDQTGLGQIRKGEFIDEIKAIAGQSKCAGFSWQGRGRAPAGYIKGMALTYARSYCRLKTNESNPSGLINILANSAGSSTIDALGLYESIFSSLNMDVKNSGKDTLRSLYNLGTGLGMRESSGKYCEGRDMSASNTTSSTAEAGLFQTSYNSINASSELGKLFAEYLADTSKCFLDVFKQGITCSTSDLSVAGSGAGATYQSFNKSCPSFAAEYAMVMLRVRRNHYGPINRKEAEVTSSCNQMLTQVETVIDNNIYACDEII